MVEGNNFIHQKLKFVISTFNVQTLNLLSKKQELVYQAKQHGIDIICLQEHRIIHVEILLRENVNGYTLITCSAWKNTRNASTGFRLSPRAVKATKDILKHDDRLIQITLDGNPRTTIIRCYSLHNEQPEDEVKFVYYELASVMDTIPAHRGL